MDYPASKHELAIHPEITGLFPDACIGWISARIRNGEPPAELRRLINEKSEEIRRIHDEETIRKVDGIFAGKQAYRQLGKDPNRYRLSAEALMRRVVKGKDLYPISSAVDTLNLVSLSTGITIGGFDAGCVRGPIELGIGKAGEEFVAIGRGALNVANLPVYRDGEGAIGNPTSDCERTRITLNTNAILMLITGFYGPAGIKEVLDQLETLLVRFCQADSISTGITGNNTP
jgi:DNA/RNA-binding domain of Phe-tRNA-synthetase-like protein